MEPTGQPGTSAVSKSLRSGRPPLNGPTFPNVQISTPLLLESGNVDNAIVVTGANIEEPQHVMSPVLLMLTISSQLSNILDILGKTMAQDTSHGVSTFYPRKWCRWWQEITTCCLLAVRNRVSQEFHVMSQEAQGRAQGQTIREHVIP